MSHLLYPPRREMPESHDWQRLTLTINALEVIAEDTDDSDLRDAANADIAKCDIVRDILEQGGSVPSIIIDTLIAECSWIGA